MYLSFADVVLYSVKGNELCVEVAFILHVIFSAIIAGIVKKDVSDGCTEKGVMAEQMYFIEAVFLIPSSSMTSDTDL